MTIKPGPPLLVCPPCQRTFTTRRGDPGIRYLQGADTWEMWHECTCGHLEKLGSRRFADDRCRAS